jgi:hypothetical protein
MVLRGRRGVGTFSTIAREVHGLLLGLWEQSVQIVEKDILAAGRSRSVQPVGSSIAYSSVRETNIAQKCARRRGRRGCTYYGEVVRRRESMGGEHNLA